jgi:cell division FtsZ-interacting protein ZapD
MDNNNLPISWLRSKDMKKLLKISDSLLQNLRINGTIPAYKLGSTWFYKLSEIIDVLENNRLKIKGKYE